MRLSVRLAVPGLLSLALAFSSGGCASREHAEANETVIKMSDVPPRVKATLDRETAGGKVTEAEKEMMNGKAVYSFDAEIGGKEYDIAIAEDGTLLSKEPEHAEPK